VRRGRAARPTHSVRPASVPFHSPAPENCNHCVSNLCFLRNNLCRLPHLQPNHLARPSGAAAFVPMLPTYCHFRNWLRLPPLASGALVLWALAVGAGWAAMARYEFQVVDQASTVAARWPEGIVERLPDRPTLVVCLHPKCPCSRATLSELERLLARPAVAATHPAVLAVLAMPADSDDSWTGATLIERCRRLPESRVEFDRGGQIAAAFGAASSGEVLLFDSAGERLFAGGVTASRGHEGTSTGGDALAALLEGAPSATASTPVFGCRLVAPAKGELQQCKQDSIHITDPLRPIAHIPDPALKQGERQGTAQP
jgi:hypothetical protein